MKEPKDLHVSFSHVQLYVDHLEELSVYQQFQDKLDAFDKQHFRSLCESRRCVIESKKQAWEEMLEGTLSPLFVSHGRDIVKQFLAGLGFRITRAGPQRMLVTSSDPSGVQFIIAARNQSSSGIFSQGESLKNSTFLPKTFAF